MKEETDAQRLRRMARGVYDVYNHRNFTYTNATNIRSGDIAALRRAAKLLDKKENEK